MTGDARTGPRRVFAMGAAVVALSTLWGARETATLAAQEATLTEVVPEGATQHTMPSLRVAPRGSVRVTACAPRGVTLEATLRVAHQTERFSRGAASVARCSAASWVGTEARQVSPAVHFTRPAPRGTTLTLRHGGSLGAHNVGPALGLLLGIALMVLSPLGGPTPGPVLQTVRDRAGVLRGLVRALGGIVAAHIATTGVYLAGGQSPLAMLAAVFVQNLGMVLAAAWAVDAFDRGRSWREALELVPPPPRDLARALLIGALLVAIAVLLSAKLKDPGDTPIGHDIEQMPLRYVIVLGGVLAPLGEELFYRSVLGRLSAPLGRAATVLLPAAAFTAMHVAQLEGSTLALAPIAAVGVVNGLVRLGTGSVVAPWLVHTTYNVALVSSALVAD